jgi:hypothetical protein
MIKNTPFLARTDAFRLVYLLGLIGLASFSSISVSLALLRYFDPRTDVCVLVSVPTLCLFTSVSAWAH